MPSPRTNTDTCQSKNNVPGDTAAEKLWKSQVITRHAGLDHWKYQIVMLVWDKSTAWGKEWAFVSLDNFSKTTGISRRKVVGLLADLIEAGVLVYKRTSYKNGYSVDYEVIMAKLGTKGRQKIDQLVHGVHSASAPGAPNTERVSKENTNHLRDAAQVATPEENQDWARRHWSKKNAKAFMQTWKIAWGRAFEGTMFHGWSTREQSQASLLAKRWPGSVEEFHRFLDWLVRDWRDVNDALGLSRGPRFPHVGFVLKLRARYFGRWDEAMVDKPARPVDDRPRPEDPVSKPPAVVPSYRMSEPAKYRGRRA